MLQSSSYPLFYLLFLPLSETEETQETTQTSYAEEYAAYENDH